MNNTEDIVIRAMELLKVGKQTEAIELMKQAAQYGHPAAISALEFLSEIENKKKQFTPNPLGIVDDPELNSQHKIQNLVSIYKNDLGANMYRLQILNNGFTLSEVSEMLVYYTLDLLIEYRKKSLNYLPLNVVIEIKKQVKEAFELVYINNGLNEILNTFENQIMIKIWENKIELETQYYIEKLSDNNFK